MVNMNTEFKLNLYFNLYKDAPLIQRNDFRKKFIKKYGKFECLEELIFMIEQYQIETYGSTLYDYVTYTPSKKKRRK